MQIRAPAFSHTQKEKGDGVNHPFFATGFATSLEVVLQCQLQHAAARGVVCAAIRAAAGSCGRAGSVCRSITWKFLNRERAVLKYAGPLYLCRETLGVHRERISAWQKCRVTEEPGIVRRAFFHDVRCFVLRRNFGPGTAAPLASRTWPANELVYVCAAVKLGSSTRHTITTTTARHQERQIEDTRRFRKRNEAKQDLA